MSTLELFLVIVIPSAFILLVLILFLVCLTRYSHIKDRLEYCFNSRKTLAESFLTTFNYIPSVLQNVKLDSEQREELKSIYSHFKSMDLEKDSLYEIAQIDSVYERVLNALKQDNKDNETLDFVFEMRRLTSFSVYLYNNNVKAYNSAKKGFINSRLAKFFRFEEVEMFSKEPYKGQTTIDFQLNRRKK